MRDVGSDTLALTNDRIDTSQLSASPRVHEPIHNGMQANTHVERVDRFLKTQQPPGMQLCVAQREVLLVARDCIAGAACFIQHRCLLPRTFPVPCLHPIFTSPHTTQVKPASYANHHMVMASTSYLTAEYVTNACTSTTTCPLRC